MLLAAGAAWKIWEWCDAWLGHDGLTERLIVVFLPLASAATIYGVSALALRIPAARDIAGMVSKRLSGKETA